MGMAGMGAYLPPTCRPRTPPPTRAALHAVALEADDLRVLLRDLRRDTVPRMVHRL